MPTLKSAVRPIHSDRFMGVPLSGCWEIGELRRERPPRWYCNAFGDVRNRRTLRTGALADVDGNRTRRTGIARPNRFEGGGAHQVPGHLHDDKAPLTLSASTRVH